MHRVCNFLLVTILLFSSFSIFCSEQNNGSKYDGILDYDFFQDATYFITLSTGTIQGWNTQSSWDEVTNDQTYQLVLRMIPWNALAGEFGLSYSKAISFSYNLYYPENYSHHYNLDKIYSDVEEFGVHTLIGFDGAIVKHNDFDIRLNILGGYRYSQFKGKYHNYEIGGVPVGDIKEELHGWAIKVGGSTTMYKLNFSWNYNFKQADEKTVISTIWGIGYKF